MMRRLTLLLLVVTAVLIPGKGRAQGGRTIGPSETTSGSVVVFDGDLHVRGAVHGSATALKGNVIVHKGGRVEGDATAIGGKVVMAGGTVGGKIRTITSDRARFRVRAANATFGHSTGRSVGMALGWLVLVAVVGFVLMAFGPDRLQIVVNTMQAGVGKSLGTGLLGQLLLLPAAMAVCVLLAATLIGILLIPLGLMAFMLIVTGMAMFGFIAVATMTGAALTAGKQRDETPNGAMLRAFLTGSAVFMGIWVLAAALSGIPLVGAMASSFASAVTFIATTTGFGAVLLSYWRGDFKRPT